MIAFFRRIRQKLLSENRVSKYLLYALGEILLVVVGILIALQINNWNELRKQQRLEVSLLEEMRENLLVDLDDIQLNIRSDSAALYSNRVVLRQLEGDLPYHDSLSVHYGRLAIGTTFVENISAYENLKTFGVNLISNDSLRRRITNLYAARYPYIDEILLRNSNKFLWEQLNPILIQNLRSRAVLADARPVYPEEILTNHVLEEHLRWHIGIKGFVINLYKDTENEIQEIIAMIDEELGAPLAP